MTRSLCIAACVVLAAAAGCKDKKVDESQGEVPAARDEMPAGETGAEKSSADKIEISSGAFEEGEPIPGKYTCSGQDVSPPLEWKGAPGGVKSFALICDDPDAPAGTWVHWVIYNIPADATSLEENVPKDEQAVLGGVLQGMNDFGKTGYGGPCPPPGRAHRYFFKIFALDFTVQAAPKLNKEQLLEAIEGHVLAEGKLMGTFKR